MTDDERLARIEATLGKLRPARWTMDYPVNADDIRWLLDLVRALEDEAEKYRIRAYLLYVAAKNAGMVAVRNPLED